MAKPTKKKTAKKTKKVGNKNPAAKAEAPVKTAPDTAPRPIHLLPQPEPLEVLAPTPLGPPAAFRWRRRQHRVVSAEGPERIAPEWWRHLSPDGGPAGLRHVGGHGDHVEAGPAGVGLHHRPGEGVVVDDETAHACVGSLDRAFGGCRPAPPTPSES